MRYIYLHGFASSARSSKAAFFAERMAERGVALDIPDLYQGDFEHTTLTRQLALVHERVGAGPALLIGSSLGGYLAALFAARHPDRAAALVLLAPAFGMARRWSTLLGPEAIRDWRERGSREVYHYGDKTSRRIAYDLIADGLAYEDFPAVPCPALVIHGRRDDTVDYRISVEFAVERPNVELVLLDSDHQLLDVLEPMWRTVQSFLDCL